jgi:Glycosyl hydrolase family 99/Dockerin type I domain
MRQLGTLKMGSRGQDSFIGCRYSPRCDVPEPSRGIPGGSASRSSAMKSVLAILAIVLALLAHGSSARAQGVPVTKTNPLKVYMHYMPWFDAPTTPGGTNWGIHWTMANQNPNIVDASGKRQIASHYYPLIGPYESSDPDVIEYHFLLMKYSGVDGILMDWYGVQGTNGDVGSLLTNSNAIVDQTDDFGMKFGVVLEDHFAGSIDDAKANVAYLRDHYFNRPDYIRLGTGDDPLLAVFGPQTFQQPAQWTDILAQAGEDVNFLPLWYEKNDAGSNADGEFAWVYQDGQSHLTHTTNFYTGRAPSLNIAGGAAYPGFDDFYQEGGWGANLFKIPANNGQTLQQTLDLANQYSNRIDFLQLVTWNDFGEGTMLEPTVETGFSYLRQLQQFTGVSYDESELQLIYRLYMARKKYAGQASIDSMLDEVSTLLNNLNVEDATALLNSAAPAGDYNADGKVDAADYIVWRNAFGRSTISHGSGADGNYDGQIDAADYTVWRDSFLASGSGAAAVGIPEPSALALSLLAAAAFCSRWTEFQTRTCRR